MDPAPIQRNPPKPARPIVDIQSAFAYVDGGIASKRGAHRSNNDLYERGSERR